MGSTFIAAYDSECDHCDNLILEGDEARYDEDYQHAVHNSCAREARAKRLENVCTLCNLIHAGGCEW